MTFYEYVITAWLLMSALMLSLSRQARCQDPLLELLRWLVFGLTLLTNIGFQLASLFSFADWSYFIGLALVLALMMTLTRQIMLRSARLSTWALVFAVAGILLAFAQLGHMGPIHHR